MINKTDKTLPRPNRKEGEETQIPNIMMREDITLEILDI